MPMTASSPNVGRLLAIAGWRRQSVNRPRNASKPPFPPMEERAGMLRAGAALSMVRLFSLILYLHAHVFLIGGPQLFPVLHRPFTSFLLLLLCSLHFRLFPFFL